MKPSSFRDEVAALSLITASSVTQPCVTLRKDTLVFREKWPSFFHRMYLLMDTTNPFSAECLRFSFLSIRKLIKVSAFPLRSLFNYIIYFLLQGLTWNSAEQNIIQNIRKCFSKKIPYAVYAKHPFLCNACVVTCSCVTCLKARVSRLRDVALSMHYHVHSALWTWLILFHATVFPTKIRMLAHVGKFDRSYFFFVVTSRWNRDLSRSIDKRWWLTWGKVSACRDFDRPARS